MIGGEILGERYQIQQQLGKKAGRRTFLAQDISTEESVVVKLLSWGSDFEWDDLKLFEREAAALKSLSHPAIPSYLNYFEVKSPQYQGFALVQTYIPFPTLEQYIHGGRTFTGWEVKEIAKAVLEILIYLHSLNPPLIHRDIKPSNILLGERSGNSVGKVYLVDFGSVQTLVATEGGTRTVVGTYGYMPQEQFGGRAVPASDLYSLGATLIYLVTGTHPADLPQKDFRIQFEQIANLSPAFTNWLQWMIQPNLDERFSFAQSALAALEKSPVPKRSNSNIGKISRPKDTRIQLTKNQDSLQIIIPPVGFGFYTIYSLLVFISVIGFFCYIFWLKLTFGYHLFNLLFLLINVLLILLFISMFMLFIISFFGRCILRLNQEKIYLVHELFGRKFALSEPANIKDVCMVQKIRGHVHYIKGVPIRRPKIVIWAGKSKKFEIGGDNELLTEPELDWLVTELSDWLDIPINRE
jgi:serine/threonine protein kinase